MSPRSLVAPLVRAAGLVAITVACLSTLTFAAAPQDHALIKPYPGSVAARRDDEGFKEYKVVVGTSDSGKTDDEVLKTIAVQGKLTRINYENPGGRSYVEILANYRKGLSDAGFEILFECTDKDCGLGYVSSRWGRVTGTKCFSSSMGYLSARLRRDEGDVYVAISAIAARHEIDVLEAQPMETGLVTVTPEALRKGLDADGRVVLDGILFDHDKAVIKPESAPALAVVAKFLKDNPAMRVFIVGHTDTDGTLDYNLDLSRKRAAAVVEALTQEHGIAAGRLSAHGVGPLSPARTNQSEDGKVRNRRVEMVAAGGS